MNTSPFTRVHWYQLSPERGFAEDFLTENLTWRVGRSGCSQRTSPARGGRPSVVEVAWERYPILLSKFGI